MTRHIEDEAPRLMSPEQVARVFGVDAKTVSRWADEGRMRYIRTPGGHRRFFEAEILDSIKAAYAEMDANEEDSETEELHKS